MVDHRSNALRRLCLQGTAALLCMAQCSGASGNDLNERSPKGASFTARWVSPLPHRCMKSSSGSTRGTRRRPSCAVRCPMKMVRAPELESGLREWHSHVLPLNTTPAFLPGRGARRAGRQQPARRRAPQPGTLAIQIVKELPLSRRPPSVEAGVVQVQRQNKTPGGLASIRAFMTPKGLDGEGTA